MADETTLQEAAPQSEEPSLFPQGAALERDVTGAVPSLIHVYDVRRGTSVFQSRPLREMLGFPASAGALDWARLVHPDDATRLAAHRLRLAQLRDGESVSFTYRMRSASGAWRWLLSRDSAFRRDGDGELRLVIGSTSDITEEKATADALRDSEARLRFAAESARFGMYDHQMGTRTWFWSAEALDILGLPRDASPTWPAVEAMFDPDDVRAILHDVRAGRQGVGAGEIGGEYRITRPDGSRRWVLVRGRVIFTGEGTSRRAERVSGIILDTTDRNEMQRRHEAQQKLLIDELNHRVKNTLAVVHSMAMQTQRAARSPDEFFGAFEQRIVSLAAAHDLLTREHWKGASLEDVLRRTLAPHHESEQARVQLAGPPARLLPNVSLALSMAFHELATNAVKHGALSAPGGSIAVTWGAAARDEGGRAEGLAIRWVERGGPPVAPPQHQGFGARLLGRGLARELHGDVALRFVPTGLECHIWIPDPHMEDGR